MAFHSWMYFSMQAVRQVCSLEERLEPGDGTHFSKQFSFTFWNRGLAFALGFLIFYFFKLFSWRRGEGQVEEVTYADEGAGVIQGRFLLDLGYYCRFCVGGGLRRGGGAVVGEGV